MENNQNNNQTGLQVQEERLARAIIINPFINNMGTFNNYKKILLNSSGIIFISYTIAFSIIYYYNYYNNFNIYNMFLMYKDFLTYTAFFFIQNTFDLINNNLKLVFENLNINPAIKEEILSMIDVFEMKKTINPNKYFYYINILAIFIFILLNFLNILQTIEQVKLSNHKVQNYYIPKIFIFLKFFFVLNPKHLYIKQIKQLKQNIFFNQNKELKKLILENYFNINTDEAEKYEVKENIETFLLFYSYTILTPHKLPEKEKKEAKEKEPAKEKPAAKKSEMMERIKSKRAAK
ncbi:MAG: hypothetical protein PHF17_00850 [Arcobacteraceae bacterium]|nr:hypothetical protein [Arcobacteraceae bacterium]